MRRTQATHGSRAAQRRAAALLAPFLLLTALSACLRQPPPASGVLSGVVTLEDGSPAAGAELTLLPEPGAGSSFQLTATLDEDGSFRRERVRVGTYWLTLLSGDAQGAVVKGVEVREDEETVANVVLRPTGTVSGEAILGDRPDDGGVQVRIVGTPIAATTTAGGGYELSAVPEGTFDLAFTAAGYADATAEGVAVNGGEQTAVPEVTLERVAPYARFTASVRENVVHVDASASHDPTGQIVRYTWDFGDGARLSGGPELRVLEYAYAGSGSRTITLTVLNDRGHADSSSLEVTVTLPLLRVGGGPYDLTVPAGTALHWDVAVPPGTRGGAVYLEVERAPSIQVSHGSSTYYSTAQGTFRRLADGERLSSSVAGGSVLSPQAVSVNRSCRGPCVILPRGGNATLTVHNPGRAPASVRVHLTAEPFADTNEPNDNPFAATEITGGTDSGAIEVVGDVDWYTLSRSGTLTFHAPAVLDVQATLYAANGVSRLLTLTSGLPVSVQAGQRVQVRAARPEAGPAAVSTYHLSLD